MRSRSTMFWTLVVAALALRVAQVLALADPGVDPFFAHPLNDPAVHDRWARGLLDGTWPPAAPFFRAPLYPFLLGGLYAVFGPENRLAALLVQALVSAFGAGLAGLAADRICGRRAGWLAGLLLAASWTSLHFAGELLDVSTAVTLLLLTLWLLLRDDGEGAATPGRAALFVAGLALGLAAITRPTILILLPVAAWYLGRHRRLRATAAWLALAAGLALPILPVTAHNLLRGGDLVPIASSGGVNFFVGNNEHSSGQTAFLPGLPPDWSGEAGAAFDLARRETGRDLSPAQADRWYLGRGLCFWVERPGAALKLTARKVGLLLAPEERSNNENLYFWRQRSWLLRWPVWPGWGLVLFLAVLGFFRRDLHPARRFLLLGSAAAYALAVVIFFVNARYRLPALALLTIPAGAGLDRVIAALRARRWPDAWRGPALAVVLLAAGLAVDATTMRDRGDDDFFFSWTTLGDGFLASGDAAAAREAYVEAVRINQADPQPFHRDEEDDLYPRLAGILGREGRGAEAVDLLRGWVRQRPAHTPARILLGERLLESGDAAGADAEFARALAAAPGNLSARLGLAWSLQRQGRAAEALEQFGAVAGGDEVSGQARFGAGLCLIDLGRLDEAERAFRDVLAANPQSWQALGNLAGILDHTGRQAEAAGVYRRLLVLRPDDPRAREWLREHGQEKQ